MKLVNLEIDVKNRSEVFKIYPIGDVHLGARDCAEGHLRRFINQIAKDKNMLWIGGGDYLECIKPSDLRRFEFDNLPDWMLDEKPDDIRDSLRDIIRAQRRRFESIVQPIKNRCIGLIEGNHEYDIQKKHNQDVQDSLCHDLDTKNLTNEAMIRIRFKRGRSVETVKMFIEHGWGGGRSAGAEPNKLQELTTMFDADIILRGHSHTFCIHPPQVRLGVPTHGRLPNECTQNEVKAGNWGCWRKSYKVGASTYVSRKGYRPRPLNTIEIEIRPHRDGGTKIWMKEAQI